MVLINRNQMSLYQEVKAGLSSLLEQTAQIFVGLIVMLLLTGGHPSGFIVALSFGLGVGFVAWSEHKRLTRDRKDVEVLLPRDISPNKRAILYRKFELVFATSPSVQNFKELIQQVVEINTDRFFDLAKFVGLDPKIDFAEADLRGTDLSNADLSNADLRGTILSGVNLSNANLCNSILRGADLRSANLSNATLIGVDFSHANLGGAKIDRQTKLDDKWYLVWKIINQGAQGQDLSNLDLSYAYLHYANLNNTNLSKSNLIGTDLKNATLLEANLSETNLIGANVEKTLFGKNIGISEAIKHELISRRANFEESPGDRSEISNHL